MARLFAKREWSFTTTEEGGSEMNGENAFGIVCEVIDELIAKAARRRIEITHVAMCSFWHSLVGVDEKRHATTPVLGWADTRSRNYSAVLKKRFHEPEIHDRTGAHFHSSFWPPKLLWLQSRHDDLLSTAKWLGFGDFVAMRLCGEAVTSVSMASATGIFDQRRCDWDTELLRYLKVPRDRLPRIARAGKTFELTAKFAKRWPRLKDARIFPAIGDGAADHVGSCGVGRMTASLMIGTSAAMRVAYEGEAPIAVPPGLWSYRIDRTRVIVGGALSDGGNLYEKFRRELRIPRKVAAGMLACEPGAHDFLVLPFFFGERSTGYSEDAVGAVVGTDADIEGIDVLQAAMEGVAFRLADIYQRLKRVGRIKTIVASGGALRDSAAWPQILADVLGHDLELSESEESASRGAVLLALESLGKIEASKDSQGSGNYVLAFRPDRHAVYRRLRRQHDRAISKSHGEQS
jgi:gluconokinase